jgi:hypothetical protein
VSETSSDLTEWLISAFIGPRESANKGDSRIQLPAPVGRLIFPAKHIFFFVGEKVFFFGGRKGILFRREKIALGEKVFFFGGRKGILFRREKNSSK